ncbi:MULTISPECIES: phosphotransferase family protein [unclassified Paenibacillus]|uniref:phosphotransferase family protein n=1 Tax=unclassified Paenibacillus TaxID=185978 RepID=UPI00362D5DB5
MAKDINLQPNASDPVLDEATVLSLVRRHVPDAKGLTDVDESGGEARTYAVDDHIILKTQRPHRLRAKTSLEKEAFFLRELAKYPDIRVPRVYGYGKEGSIEYTCMTRIPGIAVKHADLSAPARKEMLFQLGITLRQVHGIAQQPFIDSGLFPGDRTFEDTKNKINGAFDGLVEKLRINGSSRESERAQMVAKKSMEYLPDTGLLVAVHANPATTHTFVDPDTGEYTGTIDFGDAYISHPIFDLRKWGIAERESLLSGYISEQPIGVDFKRVWNVVEILDTMIESHSRGELSVAFIEVLLAKLN